MNRRLFNTHLSETSSEDLDIGLGLPVANLDHLLFSDHSSLDEDIDLHSEEDDNYNGATQEAVLEGHEEEEEVEEESFAAIVESDTEQVREEVQQVPTDAGYVRNYIRSFVTHCEQMAKIVFLHPFSSGQCYSSQAEAVQRPYAHTIPSPDQQGGTRVCGEVFHKGSRGFGPNCEQRWRHSYQS